MERWNAYTRTGDLTETVLTRGETIPDGLYHMVCEVLVQHIDGSFLCMKRDPTKRVYPGYFEATAGGSALLGESPVQCIQRELYEETGIVCGRFEEVEYHVFDDDQCIFYSFYCQTDCDKNGVKLQPGETVDFRWMPETEFIEFIHSGQMIDRQKKRYATFFRMRKYIKE